MGINHLQLSPAMIAAMYPESLVSENLAYGGNNSTASAMIDQAKKPGYPFLGKNRQSICFVVSCADVAFMPKDQLLFLQRILAACKCSLDDIALINTKHHPITLEELKKQLHPRILFFWGVLPSKIGIGQKFPDLSISHWDDTMVIPVAHAELMSGESPEGLELKKSLWMILKKLFNL